MDGKLEWKNINFFDNDFSDDVGNILFGQPASQDIDLMSPCNTSDGWLKKKWKIIDTKRFLIKAGSNPFMQEPINEVFGTRLHQRLGYKNYVSYNVLLEDGIPYSVCENFIDINTEYIILCTNLVRKIVKLKSEISNLFLWQVQSGALYEFFAGPSGDCCIILESRLNE